MLSGSETSAVANPPRVLLAAAAFFGFGLITSNLPRAIGTIFGERLYYAPSLAASCLVAWLVERGVGRIGGCRVLMVVWLLVSAGVIVERNWVWKDDATLFLHEAESNPKSVRMLVCAASARLEQGRPDDAVELLRRAVELLPGYGLAEATLFVTCGAHTSAPPVFQFDAEQRDQGVLSLDVKAKGKSHTYVGLGRPWLGQDVRIVDPDTRRRCTSSATRCTRCTPLPGRVSIWVYGMWLCWQICYAMQPPKNGSRPRSRY